MADSGVLTDKTDEKKKYSSYISLAPMRRLMKNEGAKLVSKEAIELLVVKLQEVAGKIVQKALIVMKDDKRKRLSANDISSVLP